MFSFRGLSSRFGRFFRGWDRTIGVIFRPLRRFCLVVFFGLWNWARSSTWSYFLQGIPALAASIAICAIVLLHFASSNEDLEARYLEKAQTAMKEARLIDPAFKEQRQQKYSAAIIGYERLASMGKDRPENLYEMALALEQMNDGMKAFKIINQLAPLDQAGGYGLAHLWMAQFYWTIKGVSDPQQVKLVEKHINRALKANMSNEDNIRAHGFLGEYYANTGKPELAESELAIAVKDHRYLRLLYAQTLAAQKKSAQATEQGKLAVEFFKSLADLPNPSKEAVLNNRIDWARSLRFLEEFQPALDVLQEGFDETKDVRYHKEMANVCLVWHVSVVKNKPDDFVEQWKLVEKGLSYDSANLGLLDRLHSSFVSNSKDREKALALLVKNHAKPGGKTSASHFLLGMEEWQKGNAKDALFHLEQAHKKNPNQPTVANNLAFVMAHSAKPELPEALKIIEYVVLVAPKQPTFRETRGGIYMKMGKWKEAVEDFEFVNETVKDFPNIHHQLDLAYTQLGRTQLAEEHRQLHDLSEKKRKTQPK